MTTVFDITFSVTREENSVVFELPSGKIGKDGAITLQKGQKGWTCFFYAIKRILTTEQIRSPHGQACSLRRKTITATVSPSASAEELYVGSEAANRLFLESKDLDSKRTTRTFMRDLLKESMAEVPSEFLTQAMLDSIIDSTAAQIATIKPWHQLEQLNSAVHRVMAAGHGLKEIPCKDLMTCKKLMSSLETKGPLLINGQFGQAFYMGHEPIKFAEKLGEHALYGWKKGTPTTPDNGFSHTIILIGAECKGGREYVYWIDPSEPSDPSAPGGQRKYVSSFESIINRMRTITGVPLSQLTPSSKAVSAGALYNPKLSP